jgi:hypothetical protein
VCFSPVSLFPFVVPYRFVRFLLPHVLSCLTIVVVVVVAVVVYSHSAT